MKKELFTMDDLFDDSNSSVHSYDRTLSSLLKKGVILPITILCILAIAISGLIIYGFAHSKAEASRDIYTSQIETLLSERLTLVNSTAAGLSDYRLTKDDDILFFLNAMVASNENVSAAYSCFADNSYIISGKLLRNENFTNIVESAWYKNAVSAPQGITISEPLIDSKTGKTYITISQVVYAYTSVSSVIGVDIYIDDLLSLVESFSGNNDYTYILTNGSSIPANPSGRTYKSFSSAVISNTTTLGNDYNNELSFISSKTMDYTGWQIVYVHSALPYITALIAICLGFILLSIIFVALSYKSSSKKIHSLVQPLNEIAKRANDISNGDFTYQSSEDTEHPAIKELLLLDKALTNITTTIQESLEILVKGTNAILNNTSFSVPKTFKGDFMLIRDSLISTKKAMKQSASDINAKRKSIHEYSNKLDSYIQSTKEKASEDALALDEISNNLSTVDLHSRRINLSADTVKDAASTTNSNLMRGNREMKDLLTAMEQIEESYTSITSLIYDINTFSEQTNLLSLNASIEAARMGDFGKEYASVADEINMLSAACSKSINKIELFINDSAAAVEKGRDMIIQTSESITKGISDSQNTKYNVDEIVFIVEQQQETIADIEFKLRELKSSIISEQKVSE